MNRLLGILVISCFIQPLFSQNISGDWKGVLDVSGQQLPILFHFRDSDGKITGKWDSPAQNAIGLPFGNINIKEDSIIADIKMIAGSYAGRLIGKDSIAGMWHQGNSAFPLNFIRYYIDTASSNNESPAKKKTVYPNEIEISIPSSVNNKIYGTLLSKSKDQKLAIIIPGSGPTDRNGNNPLGVNADSYSMLAHSLDAQNIATFRYDKSGIGKSALNGINESGYLFENSIADVRNIIVYLRDTHGFKNIYLIGHSEGSLIGMVAAQTAKVQGFISIAGAGRPFDVLINEQANTQQWPDSLKSKTAFILSELKNGKEVDKVPAPLIPVFRKSVQPYLISLLKYSPEKEIAKLKCPILILQGACDIQVKPEDASSLHNANKKSIVNIIASMTHTLKNAGKDCADQQKTYTDNKLPLNTTLVTDVVNFIRK